jgi:DNA-binding response OmpR family regulator
MKTFLITPDKVRAKRWRLLLDALDIEVAELGRLDLLENRLRPAEPALAIIDSDLLRVPGNPLAAARAHCSKLIVLAFGDESALYGPGIAQALAAGAVDFLNEGQSDDELEKCVAHYLKAATGSEKVLLSPDEKMRVVCAAREVSVLQKGKWQAIEGLKPKEYELLCALLKFPQVELTREALIAKVWGKKGDGVNPEALDKQVGSLRKKLGIFGQAIETVRGVGYRLV